MSRSPSTSAREEWKPWDSHEWLEVPAGLGLCESGTSDRCVLHTLITPEDYAAIVALFHWVLVPLIGVVESRRILRRARQGV